MNRPHRGVESTNWLLVVMLSLAQGIFLYWAAGEAVATAHECRICDTTAYYFPSAAEFTKSGLLFTNVYDGYRSYFFPLVISIIQQSTAAAGLGGEEIQRYTYTISFLFWVVSIITMHRIAQQLNARLFVLLAVATLINPFLLVYVPFALQEGILMFFCLPMLFVWVGARDLDPVKRAGIVLLMALFAYIIRASFVWLLVPAALYAAQVIWPHIRTPGRWLPMSTLVAIIGIALVGPQSYVAQKKFHTLNPYPATSLIGQQISWGVTVLKFTLVEDEGHARQLAYLSPFAPEAEEAKTIRYYVDHPARGAFLAASHVYTGFHYDQLKPYWRLNGASPLTVWLVVSSAVVFLGLIRVAHSIWTRKLDADCLFMILSLMLSVVALLFIAAEARFGIIGFAVLSIFAVQWFEAPAPPARVALLLSAGSVLYVVLAFLVNALLFQIADIKF